ncbi:hypothetical protein BX661DRAFT_182149 [Kickxella alabastrina]|uniref:uncharacterized protein n=1 Tax=Kickxella alabastrina TaxID=61397 RepID=UPI00221FF316|nr:uncharacterized protein BX661DRAFT_182149 [Kickxella alabastrina]KAI7828467.1 hypothetical protein BX661DRAFT_182149 [Kickxella alabastrina]
MAESPDNNRKRKRIVPRRRLSKETSPSAGAMTTRSRSQSIAQLAAKTAKTGEGLSAGEQQRKLVRGTSTGIGIGTAYSSRAKASTADGDDKHTDGVEEGSESEEKADSPRGRFVRTSTLLGELRGDHEVVAKLKQMFSDPCTLARSFPQTDAALASRCPVDVCDVRMTYSLLFGRSSDKILAELRALTIGIVTTLCSESCDEHNNQMSAVLILLLNPKITEYKLASGACMFPELCNAIMGQPPAQRNVLMQYFTISDGTSSLSPASAAENTHGFTLSAKPSKVTLALQDSDSDSNDKSASFGRYIDVFQSYISRETNKAARRTLPATATAAATEAAPQKVSLHVLNSCLLPVVAQCLALMNKYNNTHDIVPYAFFYNSVVNEHIDIKEDVPRFRLPDGVSFCSYPFLLSPTTKSEIIRIESVILMRTELQDSFFRAMFTGVTCPYLVLEVRRDSLVRDTLYQLDLKLSQDLRKQLKVRFVGEEGVDEGGVQKEFFQLIVRDVFAAKYGIFRANDESQYHWFSPQDDPSKDALEEMRLTGQLIGLAVYNAVILDIHLPPAMYKKLLGVPVTRDDLHEVDPALHHGLMQLLKMTAEELEFLDRTFEVESTSLGELRTFELLPGGAQIPLTVDNREQFIDQYVDFVFNTSCAKQFSEFKAGFDRICGTSYVRFMRPQELELLVCGCSDLDFGALEGSTIYDGGYSKSTKVIQHFWQVVSEFTDELKRKLLFFATSSDRVPIGGLSKLHFVIAKNGGDSDRLPTSHTCFNVLLLPEYTTLEKLRERLLTAIHNSEGFGMI